MSDPPFFSMILPSSLREKKKVSGSIAWVVSATFLNCHRPSVDKSQAEQTCLLQASSWN